jgi:hypothetical protein
MTDQQTRTRAIDYRFCLVYLGFCLLTSAYTLSQAVRSLKPTVTITVPQVKTTVQIPDKKGEFYLPAAVTK